MTFEQSYNETQALYELYTIMSQTKLSLHQTRQAIKAVKKAHNSITKEVQADRFNSKGIIAIVGELKNQWERYDDFRDVVTSCEKGYELTGMTLALKLWPANPDILKGTEYGRTS